MMEQMAMETSPRSSAVGHPNSSGSNRTHRAMRQMHCHGRSMVPVLLPTGPDHPVPEVTISGNCSTKLGLTRMQVPVSTRLAGPHQNRGMPAGLLLPRPGLVSTLRLEIFVLHGDMYL